MGNFLNSVKGTNVIESIDARGEAAMKTEDLVVNQGCQGKVIEEIGEVFPDIGIAVFSQALIVEAVDLGDLARFMISSEDGDARRVSNLEGNEKCNSLN